MTPHEKGQQIEARIVELFNNMKAETVFGIRDSILRNCKEWIFGLDSVLEPLIEYHFGLIPYTDKITGMKLLGQIHFLFIGGPGKGKTDSANGISSSMKAKQERVSGTEDTKAIEFLGDHMLMQGLDGHRRVVFNPGKLAVNILGVDESTRIPPKTMSALVEAMEERSFTPPSAAVEGEGVVKGALPLYPLSGDLTDKKGPRHFSVWMTANPFGEEEGTYPTPQAIWDRLTVCINLPRPSLEEEMKIRAKNVYGKRIEPVTDLEQIAAASRFIFEKVNLSARASHYLTRILRNTDPDPKVESDSPVLKHYVQSLVDPEKSCSPRANYPLEAIARVRAFFSGSGSMRIEPEHVKKVAPSVLAHRLKLLPAKRHKHDARDVFNEILEQTKIPGY